MRKRTARRIEERRQSDGPHGDGAGGDGEDGVAPLPCGYVTWGFYSVVLVARLCVFFKYFARTLPTSGVFGTNGLKAVIAGSAAIYALLVASHHCDANASNQYFYIKYMEKTVAFEILDSVQLLSILFVEEGPRFLLSWEEENCILAFGCITLVLPIVPLLQMSYLNYNDKRASEVFNVIHGAMYALFVNIPYLVIRVRLWHLNNFEATVFLVKNAVGIVSALWALLRNINLLGQLCGLVERKEEKKEENIVLKERGTPAEPEHPVVKFYCESKPNLENSDK